MKAIIEVDVPDYQIGREVSIYFKDTMMVKGIVQEPSGRTMTREEAIEVLQQDIPCEQDTDFIEALEIAIKALEQEPSGDAINREYLFKVLDDFCGHDRTATITLDTLADLVYDMPSVKQEPKTGHWISHYDEDAKEGWYECDRCHTERAFNTDYCPDCGCRMVEPQESDHKCHTCKHYTSGENDGSCGSYICKGHSNWESEDKE